jgi:F0F1-type ATP synthase membrane subunit b/b'
MSIKTSSPVSNTDLSKIINGAVVAHMRAMKTQLDTEFKRDLAIAATESRQQTATRIDDLRKHIDGCVAELQSTQQMINKRLDELNRKLADTDSVVTKSNSQLISLAGTTERKMGELMKTAGREIAKAVRDQVIDEVNRSIAPAVTRIGKDLDVLANHVAMTTEDGDLSVTEYRRAVIKQSDGSNQRRITGDEDTSHILSQNVKLAFGIDEPI